MKNFKIIVLSAFIGGIVGVVVGINIGRDKPIWSNPFAKESLTDKLKNLGAETLDKSGKALEKSGRALQGK